MNGFVLHLQGPMMSFADRGFGQLREEGEFPSRSAVIGIIAAALGLERGSERLLELHAGLRVHTARVKSGAVLVDYHTVLTAGYSEYDSAHIRREGAEGNPTLTWRSYHSDGHFVAFVESENEGLIEECWEALHAPIFTAYLGRRSCPPSTPLLPNHVEGNTLVQVLHDAVRDGDKKRSGQNYRHPQLTEFTAWLDGKFKKDDPNTQCDEGNSHISAEGFRRDLLTALPRSYVNRPVTHVRVALPAQPSTTNQEFYDAAP